MSSILTNSSAMVALQTLKTINKDLGKIQNEVSTGMKVSNAKENAASWAIAQTMRSDIGGLEAVADKLSMSSAIVGTARSAAETISDMLTEAQNKIVAGGDLSTTDARDKLVTDLNALGDQITDIINSAAMTGINLLNTDNTGGIAVTASLTRDAAGAIGTETIDITGIDLAAVGSYLSGLTEASFDDETKIGAVLTVLVDTHMADVNTAAATFGSVQKQIEIQSTFVGKFIDSLELGVSSLVDADMEAASARLTALQTQQQLGTQALSIANQAPQAILSLFQ